MMGNVNVLMESTPNTYSATNAMSVVMVVLMERVKVSLTLRFTFSAEVICPPYFLLFSLILSNMMIVLLIEYPTIVRIAATKGELICVRNIATNVNIIKTS